MLVHSNGVNVVASDELDLIESASIRLISERDDDDDEELDEREDEDEEEEEEEEEVDEESSVEKE
jgi:hypothetical protein